MLEINIENCSSSQPKSSIILPEQLVSFISLPHYQLHKLVNDTNAFVNKVAKLNNQAKQKISQQLFKQALILLHEAQKILQYAAGSGKNIDRDLIVSVLHNLSCTYQNLWILPKCSTYIEGLIFNLQNHLSSLQSSISSGRISENSYQKQSNIHIKKQLVIYQLKFLALNSQLKSHRLALNSGKKSLSTLKDIFLDNEMYINRALKLEYKDAFQSSSRLSLDTAHYNSVMSSKYTLLKEILNLNDNLESSNYKNLTKAAHFSYQMFLKQKKSGQDHPFAIFFKKYSIGNVMEIEPLNFPLNSEIKQKKDSQVDSNKQMSQIACNRSISQQSSKKIPEQSVIFMFILLSITYFSIGTQIRMTLNEQKQKINLNANKQHEIITKQQDILHTQYEAKMRESDIYHLLAIIILTSFVPFEILYLKHLLNSYKLHYSSDFFDYKTVETEAISKIIFLINGKKIERQQNIQDFENEYHLKDKALKRISKQNKIQSFKKITALEPKISSKVNKRSNTKIISHLSNKSLIIQKDEPTRAGSKSKSKQKSLKKSQSKLKKKSKDIFNPFKKPELKKFPFYDSRKQPNKTKIQSQKSKDKISNYKLKQTTRSQSKRKSKKSLLKNDSKLINKGDSNKQIGFNSKQTGLSSILQNMSKSKTDKKQSATTIPTLNSFGETNSKIQKQMKKEQIKKQGIKSNPIINTINLASNEPKNRSRKGKSNPKVGRSNERKS